MPTDIAFERVLEIIGKVSPGTTISGLVNQESGQHHRLKSVDVLLRNTRTGQDMKLA